MGQEQAGRPQNLTLKRVPAGARTTHGIICVDGEVLATMTRRDFLLASAALSAGLLTGCGLRLRRRRRRANLILIVSDTLRADRVGCCGSGLGLPPHVDSVARRGIVFTRVLSSAPLTGAAHASLMTGTYQTRHGVVGNRGTVAEGLPTLAGVLQARGYGTAAFVSSNVVTPRHLAGIERGFNLYDDELPDVERNRPSSAYRDARHTTASVLEWLQSQQDDAFFLWVHFIEPHGPYEVPDSSFLELVHDLPHLPAEPASLPVLRGNYGRGGIPKYQVLGDEREPFQYRARYAARTAYVDDHIGQLLSAVNRLGVMDDTVVAITSDHGELLGEHNYYFQHGITVLRPVLHVPLVLAGPGIESARRLSAPVGLVDVMPTVLDLTDMGSEDLAAQMQGTSLQPLLRGGAGDAERARYAICGRTKEWCVTLGRHRLTLRQTKKGFSAKLVDLQADPEERKDVSATQPETAAKLRGLLDEFMDTAPDLLSRKPKQAPALSEEDKRRLKALGYLD